MPGRGFRCGRWEGLVHSGLGVVNASPSRLESSVIEGYFLVMTGICLMTVALLAWASAWFFPLRSMHWVMMFAFISGVTGGFCLYLWAVTYA